MVFYFIRGEAGRWRWRWRRGGNGWGNGRGWAGGEGAGGGWEVGMVDGRQEEKGQVRKGEKG
jgi:hypothetical protein